MLSSITSTTNNNQVGYLCVSADFHRVKKIKDMSLKNNNIKNPHTTAVATTMLIFIMWIFGTSCFSQV